MLKNLFHRLPSLLGAFALVMMIQITAGLVAVNAQDTGQEYIVRAGDTLYEIAAEFYDTGSLWPQIVEATNEIAQEDDSFRPIQDADIIRVGQKLWIPNLEGTENETPVDEAEMDEAEVDETEAIEEISVQIVTPVDGATVPRQFEVAMASTGLVVEAAGELREGSGHMHILVDTDFVAPSEVIPRDDQYIHYWQGELTGTLELEPGEHVLRLQFSDGAHLALEGDQYRDQITVTVSDDAEVEASTEGISVQILDPIDGATMPRQFEVTMAATGLTVEEAGEVREGSGHMHILVDTDFVAPGEVIPRDDQYIHYWQGELTGTLELEPGEHVLRLQFSDGAHLALEGDQYRDQIKVTVSDDAEAEETAEDTSVQIVTPVDGATVPRQFEVTTVATGLVVEEAGEVREGSGHMHILVDTDFVAPGEVIPRDDQYIHYWQGELTGTLELEPGEHVLRLQFSDGAHLALEGDQYRDQITVTVEE